jgi:chitinase
MKKLFLAMMFPLIVMAQPQYRVGYWAYFNNSGNTEQALSQLPHQLFTHLIHFHTNYESIGMNPPPAPGGDAGYALDLVRLRDTCHAYGTKLLLCYRDDYDQNVDQGSYRGTISKLINNVRYWGYDGIDIDIES